jgi:competence protein ComEC
MPTPAALPAVGLIAGALAGALIPMPPGIAAALVGVAWIAAAVAYARGHGGMLAVVAAAGFFFAGADTAADAHAMLLHSPLRSRFVSSSLPDPVVVGGRLVNDGSRTDYGAALDLLVERVVIDGEMLPALGRVRLSVSGALVDGPIARWRAGREVRMPVSLRRPQPYMNPGSTEQELALARRGVELVGSVKSGALVEVVRPGNPVQEAAAAVRAWIRRALVRQMPWSPRTRGIATAILIGDRAGLGANLEERLRRAGTYHVIAISGGNIAILAASLIMLARGGGASPRTAATAVIAVVAAYGSIVIGGPSVARATVAAIIYFVAELVDRRAVALNLLLATAVIAIVQDPLSVLDAGFALTFGATLGILVAARRCGFGIHRVLEWAGAPTSTRRRLEPAVALLAATVAAEVMLFPVGAWTFSQVTFAGLVLNFLAIPLMSVVQIGALIAVLLSPLPWVGWPAAAVTHLAALGLVDSTRLLDWMPWLAWRVPPPPLPAIILYYVALTAILIGKRVRVRTSGGLGLVAAGLVMLNGPMSLAVARALPRFGPSTRFDVEPVTTSLRITFLDVAQGDATLVQFPGGRTLLVDAGGVPGSFDIGSRVVGPALWALGVSRLDFLLLTHAHPDHAGGAPIVIRDFAPHEVWEGIAVPPNAALQLIRRTAGEAGARWRQRLAGDFASIGGVTLRVLHPVPADWERQDVRNDDSVVLELRWRDVSVILPGDIGRDIEARIIDRLPPAPLRILKAAHHGSRTSSSPRFLHALRPDAVVFSAGRGNFYGHPAPDVLRRYQAAGAEVFRTDRDGAIVLETDGRSISFETMTGRKLQMRK